MVTAVVGVLGTLLAPVLAQRAASRQQAREESVREKRRRVEELRAAYTALNRASRQFHTLLKDALHRLRDDRYTEQDRDAVEAARLDYRDRYAEVQLIVPLSILDSSRAVNEILAAVDAAAKRIDRGLSRERETAASTLRELKAVQPRLTEMWLAMREDLGLRD